MKNGINWKTFGVLLAAGVAASAAVLPYEVALVPALARIFTPRVVVGAMIQATITFAIAIVIGLSLAKRVGFLLPVLDGKRPIDSLKSLLGLSIGLGIIAGQSHLRGEFPVG